MAKYACTWNVYNSDSFGSADKIASFNGLIGVADTWDGVTVTQSNIPHNDVGFISRHIQKNYEVYSLGIQYSYTPDSWVWPEQFGLYLPLCWANNFGGVQGYWEVVLTNGNTVRIYEGNWPDGSFYMPYTVVVTNDEQGEIFRGSDTGLALCLLPFGNPSTKAWTRGQSALLRDEVGSYGIAELEWYWDSGGHPEVLNGNIRYGDETAQYFFDLVFKGGKSIDPYDQGDPTEPGGGNPDPPGPDDDTEFPPEPQSNIADSGMITLYSPTLGQLQALADYMWASNGLDINTYKKIFADPIDVILGLSVLPITVTKGTVEYLQIGNITSPISVYKAAKQYETIDFQTVFVGKKYGSYLDFSPFTKIECYLPFIGVVQLDANDVMGKNVHLLYRFDIVSGACCAMIAAGSKQLYTFSGQCSGSVPITGHDWSNVLQGALTIASNMMGMIATGGSSAPTGIPAIASATINMLHQHIQKSGSLAGMSGVLGPLTPFLIITRPRSAWPKDLNSFDGYPSFINSNLGDLEGYTEIYKIHLENIPATGDEMSEIERLLKEGVIL